MNEKRVTLDLSKPTGFVPELRIGRGDRRGLTLVATIKDNGATTDLTGMSATLKIRVGATALDVPATASGSTVTCEVNAEGVDGGTGFAYVAIRDGRSTYSTERMSIVVVDGNDT